MIGGKPRASRPAAAQRWRIPRCRSRRGAQRRAAPVGKLLIGDRQRLGHRQVERELDRAEVMVAAGDFEAIFTSSSI